MEMGTGFQYWLPEGLEVSHDGVWDAGGAAGEGGGAEVGRAGGAQGSGTPVPTCEAAVGPSLI